MASLAVFMDVLVPVVFVLLALANITQLLPC